jgi:hypothetical protein
MKLKDIDKLKVAISETLMEIDLSVVPARLGIWFFLLVPSDNRNTRSTCPTSVFTGIGQALMSRPGIHILIFFLANLAKGNMSFCHHLASVNFSHFNLLLWNPSAKWTETWLEASMECPLWRLLISSRSVSRKKVFFRKHIIINMNCLWRPCLLMDRDEISNLYRGPSIDASYQVSVVAMFANRSGRNEQSS